MDKTEATGAPSVWKDLRFVAKYFQARLTREPGRRVRRLYEMHPPGYLFADRSMFINFGYWEDGCAALDDASAALATRLADAAGFKPGDTVLDVGFGYGDQDFLWLRNYRPDKIHGLNITPGQVAIARRRAAEAGLGDRIEYRVGSATALPFAAETFHRVVALECAHHFFPRRAFLAEAYRALRPGGVLAAADIVPVDGRTPRTAIQSKPLSWVQASVADANWYGREVYERELAAAGFTDVRVESIRDKVFEPWRRHIVAKIADAAFQRRVGRVYHRLLTGMWADQEHLGRELALLDYVLVSAVKPATPV
jgi:erythromycin 3''-O-methyltransferase